MPKSSSATPTPSERSASREARAAARLFSSAVSVISRTSESGCQAGSTYDVVDDVHQARVVEGAGREVHRHVEVGRHQAGLDRGDRLVARAVQDPAVQLGRDPVGLGERHERARGHGAELRVLPAGERLDADHLVRAEVDDRLVVHVEQVLGQRLAQVAGEPVLLTGAAGQCGVEQLAARAASGLGLGHRGVGVLEQQLGVVLQGRCDRDADAGADPQPAAVDLDRLCDRVEHLVAGPAGGLDVGVGADDDELVTADPGDDVGRAGQRAQPLRDPGEHLVAEHVAVDVVDGLELVEVDVQHGDRAVAVARVGEGLGEPVGQVRAVGQPGQRVVHGHPDQLGLELEPVADVAGHDHGADQLAVVVGERGDAHRDLGQPAVAGTAQGVQVEHGDAVVDHRHDPPGLVGAGRVQARDVGADDLGSGVAVQLLGAVVPAGDDALDGGREDRVGDRLDDAGQSLDPALGGAQRQPQSGVLDAAAERPEPVAGQVARAQHQVGGVLELRGRRVGVDHDEGGAAGRSAQREGQVGGREAGAAGVDEDAVEGAGAEGPQGGGEGECVGGAQPVGGGVDRARDSAVLAGAGRDHEDSGQRGMRRYCTTLHVDPPEISNGTLRALPSTSARDDCGGCDEDPQEFGRTGPDKFNHRRMGGSRPWTPM